MRQFNFFKIFATVCVLILGNQQINAQLVNCNVFLQGQFVEVGVNWNGAYGTSTAAPSTYHPSGASQVTNSAACGYTLCPLHTGIGFVVDAGMDGWAVGTPAFYGDYFMPGVPQEGWSIQSNGKQANAWNESAQDSAANYSVFTYPDYVLDSAIIVTTYWYDSALHVWDTLTNFGYDTIIHHDTTYYIHGANIGYDTVGSSLVGTWQGMFDSIAITQVTTLNMDSLFFGIQVTMTNLGSTPRENVYYLRTVDPDNDQVQSGVFSTINKIEYQLPNISGLTVVSARGTVYHDAYLALGTTDPRAKCFINKMGLTPDSGKISSMYAGDTTAYIYGSGATDTADVAINLAFNIGHLASVDTLGASHSAVRTASGTIPPNRAIINYAYNFNGGRVSSGTLNSTIISANDIKVYPNPVRNTISISGLTTSDAVTIYNMMGEKINTYNITSNSINTFDINTLPTGNYLVQIMDANSTIKYRTVIQKM